MRSSIAFVMAISICLLTAAMADDGAAKTDDSQMQLSKAPGDIKWTSAARAARVPGLDVIGVITPG